MQTQTLESAADYGIMSQYKVGQNTKWRYFIVTKQYLPMNLIMYMLSMTFSFARNMLQTLFSLNKEFVDKCLQKLYLFS